MSKALSVEDFKNSINKNFDIDAIPGDLPGLLADKNNPNISLWNNPNLVHTAYFYKLQKKYVDGKTSNFLISQNSINIAFIDEELAQEKKVVEVSNKVLLLSQQNLNIQSNDTNVFMQDDKIFLLSSKINNFSTNDLFVMSLDSPVTNSTINNLYLITNYVEPIDNTTSIPEINVTKLSDYKTVTGNPINILLKKISNFNVIELNSENPFFFSVIKLWNNKISLLESNMNSEQKIMPLIIMPIQTNPTNRFFDFWSTQNLFLEWQNDDKKINLSNFIFNENAVEKGYINDLISFNEDPKKQEITFKNAIVKNNKIYHTSTSAQSGFPPPDPGTDVYGDFYSFSSNWILNTETSQSSAPYNTVGYFVRMENRYNDIILEFQDSIKEGSLVDLLKKMLVYNFVYKQRFDGADYDEQGKPKNQAAKLKEIFANQKPELVIWDLYSQWKLSHPTKNDSYQAKNFEKIIVMLSNDIICAGCINNGLNDDVKVILPYYFKLLSVPTKNNNDEWEYLDIRVSLQSEYFVFDFSKSAIVDIKNNNFSYNNWFKLNQNNFTWPEISKNLEANNIPSLLPKDISLSNGEFHKYFVKICIDKNQIFNFIKTFFAKGNFWLDITELNNKYLEYKQNIIIKLQKDFNNLLISALSFDTSIKFKLNNDIEFQFNKFETNKLKFIF